MARAFREVLGSGWAAGAGCCHTRLNGGAGPYCPMHTGWPLSAPVRAHQPSQPLHSHSPALPALMFVLTCPPGPCSCLSHAFVLVAACSRLSSLVPACLCPLVCPFVLMFVCADPRYPVTLVRPSCSFTPICAHLFVFVCSFGLIPATRSHPLGVRLAFIRTRLG